MGKGDIAEIELVRPIEGGKRGGAWAMTNPCACSQQGRGGGEKPREKKGK